MTMSPVTFLTRIRHFAKVRSLFSQNESVKAVMAYTFPPGVRNGNAGMSRREIAVFGLQA